MQRNVAWMALCAGVLTPAAHVLAGGGAPVVAAVATRQAAADFSPVDRLIEAAIGQGKCPGAVVLVGRGDSVLFEKAYGQRAVRPAAMAMTVDAVFDLASLTKPIATATSIMILCQRGKVRLDDPVARYLPEFAANGKGAITIADLLLHVGGLEADDDLADYAHGPAAAMAAILATAPIHARGERFVYSDVGYIVLGELVRRVDGRRLDVFARDEIFRPLGMHDTTFLPGEDLSARCAPTEAREGRFWPGVVHDPRCHALGGVAGHAGLFSTAHDLSIYCRLLLGGGALGNGVRVLRPATVREMIQPRPVRLIATTRPVSSRPVSSRPAPAATMAAEAPAGLRGYGLDIDTPYSGPRGEGFARGASFGHTGFTGTAFWIDPASGVYYILLTSSLHPGGHGDVRALRHDVATAVARIVLDSAKDGNGR